MKTLPVPPLRQTLDRYLETAAPLLTAAELDRTRRAVAEFADGDGPRCQQALEDLAEQQNAAGRSWLWDAWLEGYHRTRTPLPLVSNVGFEIVVPTAGSGLDRAAELVHRCATVYLAHLRGEGGADLSVRGEELCQQQWDHVAGGIRDPRHELDVFLPGSGGAAEREVGVLWRGRAVAIRVSDQAGHPLSVSSIRQALARVIELDAAAEPGFTAPGYLSSDDGADLLVELRRDEHNARTHDRLRELLFLVGLDDRGGELEEHLTRISFEAGLAYPFKPVTFHVDLADDFTGMHLEHSTLDGSTLVAILGRAQQVAPVHGGPDDQPAAAEEIAWQLTGDQRARLVDAMRAYAEEAGRQRHVIRRVATPELPELPWRLSLDACLQAVICYAQLAAYGRIRSTYESVDMREYRGGRTECLRPVTAANVALAHALVDGSATRELLEDHLAAHRELVKRCKSGQAIDRHLFGLRLMAEQHGWAAPVFTDEAYRRLTTDFLSTTSLGDVDRIVRAAFCATSEGGLGVYYVAVDGGLEFSVSYAEGAAERVEDFLDALDEGVARLWALLRTCGVG
ncbi:choline/carnitine O-acyltransferase [Arsenicicoccus dermatophilus]|uniref:choline/carnitine O-acyltransferase n=1 Tax=Arsenicicoccus dermatophilus TaxID=1076331 RepID=UPI0039170E21